LRELQEQASGDGSVITDALRDFEDAVFDDLNIPGGIAVLHDVLDAEAEPADKLKTVYRFDEVLGLDFDSVEPYDIPDEVRDLVELRQDLRDQEEYKRADRLREQIQSAGYIVEDVEDGFRIRPRPQSRGR
jgi:cysteinyl-tRNA synthetase